MLSLTCLQVVYMYSISNIHLVCSYNNSKPSCYQKCLFLNYFKFIDYNLNTSSVLDSYWWWGGSVLVHHLYFRVFWSSEACLMCLVTLLTLHYNTFYVRLNHIHYFLKEWVFRYFYFVFCFCFKLITLCL